MQTFEIGELINIVVDVILLPILIVVLRSRSAPGSRKILGAAGLIGLSHVATILESLLFPRFMDILEHMSILAAGIVFLFVLSPREAESRENGN